MQASHTLSFIFIRTTQFFEISWVEIETLLLIGKNLVFYWIVGSVGTSHSLRIDVCYVWNGTYFWPHRRNSQYMESLEVFLSKNARHLQRSDLEGSHSMNNYNNNIYYNIINNIKYFISYYNINEINDVWCMQRDLVRAYLCILFWFFFM